MKEDDASLSAAGAPSESAEWQSVNRMLQHHGFAPLAMRRTEDDGGVPTFSPAPDSIRDAFTKICEAYERQQTSLQRALEEAAVADRATQSAKVSVQASADEELQRANASLEAQLEMARGRLREQTAEAEAAAATAEKALGGLRQKISQQSHAMKKNEAETQRLQERLAKELTERDSAQKARERQVFQEVHKRAARPSSAADSRSLEVISVYEAQRRTMQAELDDLRAHSTSLAAELAQKENLIQRKDAFRSWRTPDEGEMLAKLREAQENERAALAEVQANEAKAADLLRAARAAAADARREAEVERARAAALELDLSARPTVRQYADAQSTIEKLRQALPAHEAGGRLRKLSDAHPASQHPAADSSEAIRRDREVYELGLHAIQSLPPSTTIQLLQDSCREVQLQDASLLPAALRKMCRALAALPPMEAFVREVCTLAVSRGAPPEAQTGKIPSTKLVLQILRTWAVELRDLQQLVDFIGLLSDLLRKRVLPGSSTRDPLQPLGQPKQLKPGGASKSGAATSTEPGANMPLREIAHSVEELVAHERKALRALDSFERADMFVDNQIKSGGGGGGGDGNLLLSRLISHFCKLFELRNGTEAVLPKMNELYLFVGEQQNLLKVLKSMIGLSHDASVHQLLSGLRTALDLADGAQPQLDPAANPKAAPSAAGAHREGGTAAAVAGDSEAQQLAAAAIGVDAAPAKTLPQYVALAAELRKLVHAPSILAVVPAVKGMQQDLVRYKQSTQQMQVLIGQLCATLSIGSAESMIAERMQEALAAAPEDK